MVKPPPTLTGIFVRQMPKSGVDFISVGALDPSVTAAESLFLIQEED